MKRILIILAAVALLTQPLDADAPTSFHISWNCALPASPDLGFSFNVYESSDLFSWTLIANTQLFGIDVPNEGGNHFFAVTGTNNFGESAKFRLTADVNKLDALFTL